MVKHNLWQNETQALWMALFYTTQSCWVDYSSLLIQIAKVIPTQPNVQLMITGSRRMSDIPNRTQQTKGRQSRMPTASVILTWRSGPSAQALCMQDRPGTEKATKAQSMELPLIRHEVPTPIHHVIYRRLFLITQFNHD